MTASSTAPLPQTHLLTGQLVVTRDPQIVATVLGSCVTVTMFHRSSGLAAICHAALPGPRASESLPPRSPERFRYVAQAVPAMAAAFRRAGIDPRAVEVKLFGGGDVIGDGENATGSRIGAANVTAARNHLVAADLTISAESTLGHHGRKILFNTATGEVLHKRLRRLC